MDPRMNQRNTSHYNLRPRYPRSSEQQAQAESPFHSSSSVSSISSISSSVGEQSLTEQNSPELLAPPSFDSAPLPSPSQTSHQHYFDTVMAAQQQQQYLQNQQHQQQHSQSYHHYPMQGQQTGTGGTPQTSSFLKDFNLIAEAAKRAQLACLMRDMDDMEL